MRKQRIEHGSPVDALVAVAKRLSSFEERYRLASEDFFDRYTKGRMEDEADFVDWANDYEHFLSLRQKIEEGLRTFR